jgi:uncharacterized peroxidase-related enzyme
MGRIEPLGRRELSQFEEMFAMVERAMGFVPNSMLTLGRQPGILRAFAALAGAVLGPGRLPPDLKQLVALVASSAAGCRYCQAHTSENAHRAGAPLEKIQAAFEFERSPLFGTAERAALRMANDASVVPNAVTDAHFESLRRHFDQEQIVELVAVISLFGFLNRWNDTMATALEAGPLDFASRALAEQSWEAGKHGASVARVGR